MCVPKAPVAPRKDHIAAAEALLQWSFAEDELSVRAHATASPSDVIAAHTDVTGGSVDVMGDTTTDTTAVTSDDDATAQRVLSAPLLQLARAPVMRVERPLSLGA